MSLLVHKEIENFIYEGRINIFYLHKCHTCKSSIAIVVLLRMSCFQWIKKIFELYRMAYMTKDIKFYFQIKIVRKCDKFQINTANLMGLRFLKRL